MAEDPLNPESQESIKERLFRQLTEANKKPEGPPKADINVDEDIKELEKKSSDVKNEIDVIRDQSAADKRDIEARLAILESRVSTVKIPNNSDLIKKIEFGGSLNSKTRKMIGDAFTPIKKKLLSYPKNILEKSKKIKESLSSIKDVTKNKKEQSKSLDKSLGASLNKLQKKIAMGKKINAVTENAVMGTVSTIGRVIKLPFTVLSDAKKILDDKFTDNKISKTIKKEPSGIKGMFKKFFDLALAPAKWIIGAGTMAINFIWKSLKTVFLDLPYAAIKTAVSIAGKGIEAFMDWVGDMFLNIFRFPWILFIGIPFLMFVLPKILDIVWGFLKKNMIKLWNIVDSFLHLSEIWNEWLWPGIQGFWKWLTGSTLDKWWSDTLPKIKGWIYNFFVYMFGKEHVDKFIDATKMMWTWVQDRWQELVQVYEWLRPIFYVLSGAWLFKQIYRLYKLARVIVSGAWRAARWVGRQSWRGARAIGRGARRAWRAIRGTVFGRIVRRTKLGIRRLLRPIGRAVGGALKKVGAKVFGKIGLKLGMKFGAKRALLAIPVIGWIAMAAWDLYDIGKAVYVGVQALAARASARKSASEWSIKNVEHIGHTKQLFESINSGNYNVNPKYSGLSRDMEKFGLTQKQIADTLEADAAYNSLRTAAVFYAGQWESLASHASQDSSAENYEVTKAREIGKRFDSVYKFINEYNVRNYENITTKDLKEMLKKTQWAIKGTWNEWQSLVKSGYAGSNSDWVSDTNFTEGIPRSMGIYDEIVRMTQTYIKKREEREAGMAEENAKAQKEGRVANTDDMFINRNTIGVFYDMSREKNPVAHLPEEDRSLATEKLIKAIQFGYQNGATSHAYVMAGLKYNFDDPEYLKAGEAMFFEGVKKHNQKSDDNKPIPIFVPSNFTKADIEKFEEGGVIVPYETRNVVIPLNTEGSAHIRDKIRDINIPEIKKLKKDSGNITIIEQHTSVEQSYELYAMEQISRGILGVGR